MKFNAHLVNCTPHDINIKMSDEDGFFTIAPSGVVARCKTEYNTVAQVVAGGDTFNIRERYFNEPQDLPDPKEGTLYIVSRIVAEAMSGVRNDLLMVDDVIRDENGRPIGCEAFARWPNELSEADKLLRMVLDNADEADLDDEVYLDNDTINRIKAHLNDVGICDDGIACGQNNPTTLNGSGRCSSCQEERDYEDDKYPKEE